MIIGDYEYTVDQCDVPCVRRGRLSEYRAFRRKCLEYLRGDSDTSVVNQIHELAWDTAVFRTLNEARRIEPHRAVNGAMWELIAKGYAGIMTLGVRRLIDDDRRVDSVWNVIAEVEKRPELLTRENFVCHDGLPYDYDKVRAQYLASLGRSGRATARWLSTKGPQAWSSSELLHKQFDALAGYPLKRRRLDGVGPAVLVALKEKLKHPAIQKVRTWTDRRVAHAERISADSDPIPIPTYNDIDTALEIIVGVTNFLSANLFYDAAFGSVVPTPQFDVLAALDEPFVTAANLPLLHRYWDELSAAMGKWADYKPAEFLSPPDEKAGV